MFADSREYLVLTRYKFMVHCGVSVTRGCAPEIGMNHDENDCKTTEVDGRKVYFCHCSEDLCNADNTPLLSTALLIAAVFTHILYKMMRY